MSAFSGLIADKKSAVALAYQHSDCAVLVLCQGNKADVGILLLIEAQQPDVNSVIHQSHQRISTLTAQCLSGVRATKQVSA